MTPTPPRRVETAVMDISPLLLMVIWLKQEKTATMLKAVYTQTPRTKTANTANLRAKIAK